MTQAKKSLDSHLEHLAFTEENIDARINKIVQTLAKSPKGEILIKFGILDEISIQFDDTINGFAAHIRNLSGESTIILNWNYSDKILIPLLAHELRHVEQQLLLQKSIMSFSLKEAIILNRLLEADASAYAIATTLELCEITGDFSYLKSFEKTAEQDILEVFMKNRSPNKSLNDDINAYQEAFKQWYRCPNRVNNYDCWLFRHYQNFHSDDIYTLDDYIFKEVFMKINNEENNYLSPELIKDLGCISKHFNYFADPKTLNPLKKPFSNKKPYRSNLLNPK